MSTKFDAEIFKTRLNRLYESVQGYIGEGDSDEGDDDAAATQAAADAAAADAAAKAAALADPDALDLSGITLDAAQQQKLNALIKAEKQKATAKSKKQVQDAIAQLENTKKVAGISAQEKEALEIRIDQLNKSLLTKEQLAAQEKSKIQAAHQNELQKVTGERDSWKKMFTTSTIERSIMDAASIEKAFDPSQIIALLGPNTSLEPDEQNPEVLVPKVKFRDTDGEGKQVTLDLPVPAAVKRMTEIPRFFNLFETTAKSGLGAVPAVGSSGNLDPSRIKDMADYKKNRSAIHQM